MELTFETLVAELTRDANRAQPQDALRWCLNWFQRRLEGQILARSRDELGRPPAYSTSLPKDHFVDTPIRSSRQPTENPGAEAVSPYSRFLPGYRPPLAKLRGPRPFGTPNVPGNTLGGDAEDSLAPAPIFNTPVGPIQNFGSNSTRQNTSPSPAPGRSSPRTASSMIFARRTPVSTGSTAFNRETTQPERPGMAEQFGRTGNSIANGFIFRDLDEEQETWVLDSMRVMGVEAGGIVIRQGDVGEYFSVVESGHQSYYTRPRPLLPPQPPPRPSPTSLPSKGEFLRPDSLTVQPPGSSSGPLALGPMAGLFIDQRWLYGVCKSFGAPRDCWSVNLFPRSTRVQPTSDLQR